MKYVKGTKKIRVPRFLRTNNNESLNETDMIKVLFICVHNSARSQMAEAFLNRWSGTEFKAESAGLKPGKLNPLAVDVMKEEGIDISQNETKSVFDLFKRGRLYHFVISVCDQANAERCPIFPGITQRLTWSFEDPASFSGPYEEKLARTRMIRDGIKTAVENFVNTYRQTSFNNLV